MDVVGLESQFLAYLCAQTKLPLTFFPHPFAVVSPTGSRPPSRNRNTEMPGDEELGFEAAVAALGKSSLAIMESTLPSRTRLDFLAVCAGMKTTVSEAEHPLLCEGTRRVKGDLALALMITYKDDQCKLKKVKKSFTCRDSLPGQDSSLGCSPGG